MPFTYLVKFIPLGQFYYGVKYGENCSPSDLWTTYFTSSKIVHSLIEKYGLEAFEVEVRRTFVTPQEAKTWEKKVLRRMKVTNDPKWLNIVVPYDNLGFKPGDLNPMKIPEIARVNHERGKVTRIQRYGVDSFWKTKEHARAASARISLRNSKKVQCPHCLKVGGSINMARYHFTNCKTGGRRAALG